jgi:hypothetical protein
MSRTQFHAEIAAQPWAAYVTSRKPRRRSKLLTCPPELPNAQPLHQPPNRNSTRFTRTADGSDTATPHEYGGTEYGGLPVGDTRCTALLGLSSPTNAGLCVSYLWDSRHVTEPSERVGPRPSAIGYVAKGWLAAF